MTPINWPVEEDDVLTRLRQRLLGFARRTLSPDVAEDLVQETLVLLTTKYVHVRAAEERVRLGIDILVKKRAAYWRRSRRRGELDADSAGEVLDDDQPGPEELADRQRRIERLRTAVATLSGRCRELVRLKLEERTFPEIAEILQAKLNTVYSWDRRCLEKLRALLAAAEVRK